MKKIDLFVIEDALARALKTAGSPRFHYPVSKNLRTVSAETQSLRESIRWTDRYSEYEKKRIELCEQYAEKDENGKPVLVDNVYRIVDKTIFNSEIDKLREEYKDEIVAYRTREEEYKKILEEGTDIVLEHIKLDTIPDTIDGDIVHALYDIIDNS